MSSPGTKYAVIARLSLTLIFCLNLLTANADAQPSAEVELNQIIVTLLSQPDSLELPIRKRADALKSYYADPTSRPLWLQADPANAFLRRIENAQDDGLDPADYPLDALIQIRRINRLAFSREARLQHAATSELYWSAFFLKYASDLKVGRFLPTKIEPKLYWQPKKIDMVAALRLLGSLRDVDGFFNAWQPQVPDYLNLKSALASHRGIEKTGGWPKVPVGQVLKPGAIDPVVAILRQRLAVTDQATASSPPPGEENKYDEALVAAVKRFQRRHGLEDDGVIGKQTYFQLNIPVTERIRQIVMTMERWRWMPEDLGKHYIKVNIAGYELRRVRNGKTEELMRVVVGLPYHQTPVFSKSMEYVEINPYWNVPHSIAVKEELPKLRKNPQSRAAKGFEAIIGDKPVPLTRIDWSKYSRSNFPLRLRQKPGPENALGRVKFMFPNRFNVYMHDTPSRSLFARSARAFSHGCIRLARPIDMAEQVLSTVPGWDRARIDDVLAGAKRTVVSLKSPIDVHITYATAWRDGEGDVQFRPDIYNRDERLYRALFGRKYPY